MTDRSTAKMLARAAPILARLPEAGRCIVVEVGVNRGQLGEHLLAQRPDLEWHGVDPWRRPEDSSTAYVRTGDGHAVQTVHASERARAEAISRTIRFGRRASIHRMASPAAAERFKRGWATMVFVDADHSYEGVSADLEAWWPVVARGGWLGGDDYEHPEERFKFGVDRAVAEFSENHGLPVELDGPRLDYVGKTWWIRKP